MSKFRFAISNWEARREGIVEGDSFDQAVTVLGKHVDVHKGDLLEIGVTGFPPARYECVGEMIGGEPLWMFAGQVAA